MEEANHFLDLIRRPPQVLDSIFRDKSEPGAQKVGQALKSVLELSTTFLLPVKLLNEKTRTTFEKNLEVYRSKLRNIPPDMICDVNPQIGTPILDKLTYITNEEIADLFTNLLVKASSLQTVSQAHPSFIQLIERLSIDEARILKYLKNTDYIPCIGFRAFIKDGAAFVDVVKNATALPALIKLDFPANISTYIDNFVSMGVFHIDQEIYKADNSIYDPLIKVYENLKQIQEAKAACKRMEVKKSYYQITDFGKLFITACAT